MYIYICIYHLYNYGVLTSGAYYNSYIRNCCLDGQSPAPVARIWPQDAPCASLGFSK